MTRLREVKLRDVSVDIAYGYTASANQEPVGPKFLRITDIVPYRVNWDTVPYCNILEGLISKYTLEEGDVVIARTGATTGYNFVMDRGYSHPVVFASYLIRYRLNKAVVEPAFMKYILKSNDWYGYVENIIGGSAQPGANAQQFAEFSFPLRPLDEQRRIGEILSSLDDKIDLLHRQNQTLEQMAETLYRHWFEEKEDESWDRGTIADLFILQRGFDLPVQDRIYGSFPILASSGIGGYHNEYKVRGPGVTTGRSGVLGNVFYVAGDFWPLNTSLFVSEFRLSTPLHAYFFLKGLDMISLNAGSAVPSLNRNHVHAIPTLLPPASLIATFEGTVKPFFEKMEKNTSQIITLEQTRDIILPKLMSGEMSVRGKNEDSDKRTNLNSITDEFPLNQLV